MKNFLLLLLLAPALLAQTNLTTSTGCPCSIFAGNPIKKTSGPDKPVEVGIRFTSDINSDVVALRFYKMPGASGNHFGTLYNSSGSVLGTAQFMNETPSGWQQQALPFPVPIIAGQTYTVSYHTDTGYEALDSGFFSSPVVNGHLTALGGVYTYNLIPKFPTTLTTTNYWVDIVLGNFVTLSWTASTTPNSLYNVYRSTTGNFDFSSPLAYNLPATKYTDIFVSSGTTYSYVVTATIQSPPSNSAQAVIP